MASAVRSDLPLSSARHEAKGPPADGNERHHAPPDTGRNRRTLLIIGLIVLALLVFGGGYALGRGNDAPEDAASSVVPTPTPTHTRSPKPTPTDTPSETAPSGTASAEPTAEPDGETLADGRSFVRLNDVAGGEGGPPAVRYDLAYFLEGAAADQAAEDRGLETPVPDGYLS